MSDNELTDIEKFFLCVAGDVPGYAEKMFMDASQGLVDKGYLLPDALNEESGLTADQVITGKGLQVIQELKAAFPVSSIESEVE